MKKNLLLFGICSFLLFSSFTPKDLSINNKIKEARIDFGPNAPKVGDNVDAVDESTSKIVNVHILCLECEQCASIYAYAVAHDGTIYLIHTDLSSSTGWSGHVVPKANC